VSATEYSVTKGYATDEELAATEALYNSRIKEFVHDKW